MGYKQGKNNHQKNAKKPKKPHPNENESGKKQKPTNQTKPKKPQKTEKFSHRLRKNVSAVNNSILTGSSEDGFAQHL